MTPAAAMATPIKWLATETRDLVFAWCGRSHARCRHPDGALELRLSGPDPRQAPHCLASHEVSRSDHLLEPGCPNRRVSGLDSEVSGMDRTAQRQGVSRSEIHARRLGHSRRTPHFGQS